MAIGGSNNIDVCDFLKSVTKHYCIRWEGSTFKCIAYNEN